jgi:hypothetical protein
MDNKEEVQPVQREQVVGDAGSPLSGIGYQIRKGLDRMSFEADKLMRVNRVRGEITRLQGQTEKVKDTVAERVLELDAEGAEMEPSLKALIDEVRALRRQLADKAAEIEAINAEAWVEPPPPVVVVPAQEQPRKALPSGQQTSQAAAAPNQTGQKQQDAKPQEQTICPSCNGPRRPMSVFCPNCGYKL